MQYRLISDVGFNVSFKQKCCLNWYIYSALYMYNKSYAERIVPYLQYPKVKQEVLSPQLVLD